MKEISKDSQHIVLRFDKDEEAMAGLLEYVKANQIKAASLTGIGSCSQVELGFYNPFIKQYRLKPFLDNMEITSLTGSVAISEEGPIVHVHGTFANNEFAVIGGHVSKITVLATCEIILSLIDSPVNRKNNPDFNLKLLT